MLPVAPAGPHRKGLKGGGPTTGWPRPSEYEFEEQVHALRLRNVQLRAVINNVDAESVYAGLIRRHLLDNGGRPATSWRAVRDARRTDKRVSVSSLRAWVS